MIEQILLMAVLVIAVAVALFVAGVCIAYIISVIAGARHD